MLKRYVPILTCLLLLCASAPAQAQLFKGGLLKRPIVHHLLNTPVTLANTPFGNVQVTPADLLKARDSGTITVDPVVRTNLDDTKTNLDKAAKITNELHAKYFEKTGTPKADPKKDKDATKKKTSKDLKTADGPLKK